MSSLLPVRLSAAFRNSEADVQIQLIKKKN